MLKLCMYVCVCVCMYVFIYVCKYVRMCVFMHVCIINSIRVITHPDDAHKSDRNMLVKNHNTWPNIFTNCASVCSLNQHTTFSKARTPNTPVHCWQLLSASAPPHHFSKVLVIFEAPSRQSRYQMLVLLTFCTLTVTLHIWHRYVLGGCTAVLTAFSS